MDRERFRQPPPVPDEQAANLVRLEEPLVGIQGDRVHPIQSCEPGAALLREKGGSAVRSICMEPQTFVAAEISQRGQRVDRSGVDRPGVGHHAKRDQTRRPVSLHRSAQMWERQTEALIRFECPHL